MSVPENFRLVHAREEELRARAEAVVEVNPRLGLHLLVVERAINLADMFRQVPTENENCTPFSRGNPDKTTALLAAHFERNHHEPCTLLSGLRTW